MRTSLLWLLASLGLACFTSVTRGDPLKVLSAPNVLRVGTAENIFVECQDCDGQSPMDVQISAWNYPARNVRLHQTTVTLSSDNSFQAFGELVIPPDTFDKNPETAQFVYLRAEFSGFLLEKFVLVSFQSGYIFIQTDKTLYTPDSTVNFRIFALTPDMKTFAEHVVVLLEIVTPDGIVIPLDSVLLHSGLYHGNYKLGEIVSVGQWKVVARFQANSQRQYSAEFDVKQYVLPSFEVNLKPDIPFYYYDTESFSVTVTATYLFGREVVGFAYVVFGVMKDNIRKVFADSLQRIKITGGSGRATLQKAHIRRTFRSVEDLVGGILFATATVHTESGSEMVEAELRNIHIVRSPYFINFDKTPRYFKAGFPYDVTVTVTNPDGTPAGGIPVLLEPGRNVRGTTRANGRVTLSVETKPSDSSLTITAKTNANSLPGNRQTSKSMVANAQQAKGGNFIHITGISADVKFGTDLRVTVNMNNQRRSLEMTYLIISRGQLVEFGRQKTQNQLIFLNILVTKKMLPSFRLIVYYHPTRTEVVSDSVWVDVDDSCTGTLKLEPKRPRPSYEPQKTFVLKITGEPGATVGLVAVDKGVYVLNKQHLLTQKKVWEIVEKADTGCTPGGGENSMGVFFDAGLMFHTDTAVGTPYRQEVECPRPAGRKRRVPTLHDAKTTLVSAYMDPLQRECCLDGMKNTPLSYTCAQRILYITDGKACADAFFYCCEELAKQRSELKKNSLILSRSEEDNDLGNTDWITSRTKFPESWLWESVIIPQCIGNPNCEVNTKEITVPLKDSITTWVFSGISLSQNNGICVGDPLDVVVYKDFFLDLRRPYSAVLGEQIEVRAIVHNYFDDPITVIIELFENPDLCSVATKRGKYRQTVTISNATTKAVPFVIIPMKEGELKIEVKAILKGRLDGDGVTRLLRVFPNGVLTKVNKIVELAPKGSKQELTINNPIQRSAIVPNTKAVTRVFLTGREQVSPLVDTLTGVSSMLQLVPKPTGCGEQTLVHMTSHVLAVLYLDRTHQWETVGFDKRSEALSHIKKGAQNEMEFAKSDGSFAVWKSAQSNTWLTAYVLRVFSMASTLVFISSSTVCNAAKFLILNSQQTNGMFRETGLNSHRMFSEEGPGRNPDVSMTAHCLIALQESQTICYHLENRFPLAMAKAVSYLEQRLQSLTDPYAVTITSYALSNVNKFNKEMLYRFVSPDRTHWEVPEGPVYTLEATAYAVLALVKSQLLTDARPIVRWLTKQQDGGGGYGSTQATVLVYQALFEYWSVAPEPDYNLDVELTVPGRSYPYHFRFNQDNHYTRTSMNFDGNQNVKVTATGTGEATLTLVTQYYAVPKETVSDCRKFNLSVEFSLDKVDEDNGDIYKLRIYFTFLNKREDASMSILDITMPTGFVHMSEDLNQLCSGRAPVFSQWEYNKVLSERGSIIIYLPKVAHHRVEEVTFRMRQTHKVGVLQPASVSIYEYYDETKCVRFYHPQRKGGQLLYRCRGHDCLCAEETKCVRFYHPQRKGGQLLYRCRGHDCLCAEENCSMQQKGHIDNRRRLEKACETNLTSFIDFVYRVTLEEVNLDVTFDVYTMRIERVIKDGSYDKNAQGQRRDFISLSHCRKSLHLQIGHGYLIMGTADSTRPDASARSFEYELGERTWIEYWPRGEQCQRPEHRRNCDDMNALISLYETQGCPY